MRKERRLNVIESDVKIEEPVRSARGQNAVTAADLVVGIWANLWRG